MTVRTERGSYWLISALPVRAPRNLGAGIEVKSHRLMKRHAHYYGLLCDSEACRYQFRSLKLDLCHAIGSCSSRCRLLFGTCTQNLLSETSQCLLRMVNAPS